MSDKNYITYAYTPDGRKLSSRHVLNTPTGRGGYHRLSTTDLYVDGLILRNNTPLLWQFDGGYVELNENGTPTSWNYYITDHLGSTRMVVDSNNNVKETINYYPFGSEMRIQEPGLLPQLADAGSHPFRFTGKELDKQNGLNMYDFGARWFDVAGVPMWTSVDPMAEKYYPYTPYSYCAGDPVNKFDPDGKKVQLVVRQLNPYVPMTVGAHTFLIVTQAGKQAVSYTYGPHNTIGGKLERTSYNYDDQIREGEETEVKYQIIDVPIPKGMSEKQFDAKINEAAKQFEGNTEIKYNIVTLSNITGNCNTSTTTLLNKAGVSDETIKDLKKEIKGNAYGFGQTRPWTKEEREKAKEKEEKEHQLQAL